MRPIRPKLLELLTSGIRNNFQDEFSKQILINEKKRVTIISALIFFILLIQLFLHVFVDNLLFQKYPNAKEGTKYSFILLGFFLTYELLVRNAFSNFIKNKTQPPEIIRYLNAFVETSIPTVGITLFGFFQGPTDAILSPIIFIYFFFIMLSTLRLNFRLSIFTSLVAASGYLSVSLYFYNTNQIQNINLMSLELPMIFLRAVFFLIGGGIAGMVAIQIKNGFLKSIENIEERKQLMNIFGQHVSPEVVDKLLNQNVEIESEVKHVCVMFLDIRNFTSFSENKSPVEVVNYLNTLFEFMIEIVNRNNGIINKFLGDGFMAVFGAPITNGKDCVNAVNASKEILEKVNEYNQSAKIPPTKIGIGLHSGDAVTGNVGSDLRKEYTVIGDVVNLASRIEQLTKQYSEPILLSEDVLAKITGFELREIDTVRVKGRVNPVKIYGLL
ncbi:MAG: adenylate/guanylate cyclase domain-containing protein [Leptospiraceae bacterium]|nr:adenylate/guanylate cyclase domain-containing protein [Leptospiraceae bacterium]